MKVLVTGAAGFIGSHIVDSLVAKKVSVVATDDLSGGYITNVNQNVVWIQGDLRDSNFVEQLFSHHYHMVIHAGAYAAEGLSHFIRKFNYETNLMASINLINQSVLHGVKRFVFLSSIAVYGEETPPFYEVTTPVPADPYGISKYAVELDLQAAAKQFGMDYTIFRPHNVYGERQNISDPYRNVIGIFMSQILKGKPLTLFGDGCQTRAFSYIGNVAPIIASVTPLQGFSRNEIYNIGSDEPHTVLELAQLIAEVARVECNVTFLPKRNETVHAFADHEKIKQFRGAGGRHIPLKEGLRVMFNWVNEIGIPDPMYFKGNIEVPTNMPPSWKDICQPCLKAN